MKKLIILLFSIFISINSYGGIFNESICFETDGQNIVFLPNETDAYTGKYLCKYNNGQKEKEGNYKDGKLEVNNIGMVFQSLVINNKQVCKINQLY